MLLNRQPDGSFVSTPIYAGLVPQAVRAQAHAACEHAWEDFGPVDTAGVPGCELHSQTCSKCIYAKRVRITGPKAALDAFAGTLHSTGAPRPEPPSN